MRITTLCRGLTLAIAVAGAAVAGASAPGSERVAQEDRDNVPVIRVFGRRPALADAIHGQLRYYEVPEQALQPAPPARFDALGTVAVR